MLLNSHTLVGTRAQSFATQRATLDRIGTPKEEGLCKAEARVIPSKSRRTCEVCGMLGWKVLSRR